MEGGQGKPSPYKTANCLQRNQEFPVLPCRAVPCTASSVIVCTLEQTRHLPVCHTPCVNLCNRIAGKSHRSIPMSLVKRRLAIILLSLAIFGCTGPVQAFAASAGEGGGNVSSGGTRVEYITDASLNNMN